MPREAQTAFPASTDATGSGNMALELKDGATGRSRREKARQVDYGLLDQGASESIFGSDAGRFERLLTQKAADFIPTEGAIDELTGAQLNLEWYRANGIQRPVVVRERAGLGMAVPGPGFTVRDVADILGGGWPLDIIDVASQQEMHGWNLFMWADYFHGKKERKAVLNVISLEFSGTPLLDHVRAPRLVRQIDWVDTVWPRRRVAAGQYPQVQHYCLMSVAGSYTDWHIDFSGSSVWYHVHTGSKRFLFAPPTESVLKAYETWTTSPSQSSTWFGELEGVRGSVFQVELTAGNTMIIPTGWVHAVYTPSDSLVFGGNMLHGAGMTGQLRIAELELFTRVPRKYRHPYAEHLHWYAAGYYLQFARLPGFRPTLRAALRLVAREAAGASHEELVTQRSSLSAQLWALGLSWHEITGLSALVTTLAHMRGTSLQAQSQAQAAGYDDGGEHDYTAADAPNSSAAATSTDGADLFEESAAVDAESGGATPASAPTSGFATRHFAERRIKGGGAMALPDSAASSSAGEYGEEGVLVPPSKLAKADIDVFPPGDAATEAAAMANAPGGPEALLAELAARLSVEISPGSVEDGPVEAQADAEVEAAWPSPVPPSVLKQHAPATEEAAPAPVPAPAAPRSRLILKSSAATAAAAAAAPSNGKGPFSRPFRARGSMRHLPVVYSQGGFGLYDGNFPLFPAEADDTTHAGAGYSYNEKFVAGEGDPDIDAGAQEDEEDGDEVFDAGRGDDDSGSDYGSSEGGGGSDDEDEEALAEELADLRGERGREGEGEDELSDDGGEVLDVAGPDLYDSHELRAMARQAALDEERERLIALGLDPDSATLGGGKGSRGPRASARLDGAGRLRPKSKPKMDADGGAGGRAERGVELGEEGVLLPPSKRPRLSVHAAVTGLEGAGPPPSKAGGLAPGQLTGMDAAARSATSRFALGTSTAARVLGGGAASGASSGGGGGGHILSIIGGGGNAASSSSSAAAARPSAVPMGGLAALRAHTGPAPMAPVIKLRVGCPPAPGQAHPGLGLAGIIAGDSEGDAPLGGSIAAGAGFDEGGSGIPSWKPSLSLGLTGGGGGLTAPRPAAGATAGGAARPLPSSLFAGSSGGHAVNSFAARPVAAPSSVSANAPAGGAAALAQRIKEMKARQKLAMGGRR